LLLRIQVGDALIQRADLLRFKLTARRQCSRGKFASIHLLKLGKTLASLFDFVAELSFVLLDLLEDRLVRHEMVAFDFVGDRVGKDCQLEEDRDDPGQSK